MSSAGRHWTPAPAEPHLLPSDVHVWRASLDQTDEIRLRLAATLSADERERARRFHFERDRQHFITGRGILRDIIARYLRVDAAEVEFEYGVFGKPRLTSGSAIDLRFNLAHSHELALYAVSLNRDLGIDIEHLKAELALDLAGQFFSEQERADLNRVPPEQMPLAFLNCWTRKEAYIKARGEGLSFPLDAFDVSLLPGAPAQLLRVAGDPDERTRWSMEALDPDKEYIAALVVEGHEWWLHQWQWSALTPGQPQGVAPTG